MAPSAHKRAKAGGRGGARFFHIELRPSNQFVAFRVQDVGEPGGVERVGGRRASERWDTIKWREDARARGGWHLITDSAEARTLFRELVLVDGDRSRAKPRRNTPESEKPTPAMRKAQADNIEKAQAALRKRRKTAS